MAQWKVPQLSIVVGSNPYTNGYVYLKTINAVIVH